MEVFLICVFTIAAAIQFLLLIFLFPKILFFKSIEPKNSYEGASVIVAAHNEHNNLQILIPVLLSQDYPNFEIIVVDDRSEDGSWDFLMSFKDSRLKIIRIDQTPKDFNPKKYAINQAISGATYEILLFTDADCYPGSKFWISELLGKFTSETDIVLGFSPYEKRNGFLNRFIRYETILTAIQYLSFAIAGKPYMGVGRNMAYKKSVFLNSGGFEDIKSLNGGDDDLFIGKNAKKSNTEISLSLKSKVISYPKLTWKGLFVQKKRHYSAGKRYTSENKFISGLFPLSLVLMYFSIIFLIFFKSNISYILVVFILRTLVLIIIFALITRKLGETIKWLWFPILDLSYFINYLITGVAAIFSKNIKWR